MPQQIDSAAEAAEPYPSLWRAWYIVVILMCITFTGILDRYLPSIALEPMKQDFGLSDTGISLIQGLAFSLFYCVAGVPIGRLVDHHNRRNLILGAIVAWAALTVWTGLAHSFVELFVARAGVGIAEAVLAPATYSMIADIFPPRLRGRATGIYFSSLIFGASGSFIVGGSLLAKVSHAPVDIPMIGVLAPWRECFILLGLLGIPAVLAGLTFREPARRETISDGDPRTALSRYLRANTVSVVGFYTIFGIMALISTIAVSWAPTLFVRTFGMAVPRAAMAVGFALLLGGIGGCVLSGWFSDRWMQRSAIGRFRVQMASLILSTPLLLVWPCVPNAGLSYALLIISSITMVFGMSSISTTIQDVAPNQLRGQLIAINQIVMLLTSGLAPTVVALVTDKLFASPAALPWSMGLVGGVFGLIGAVVALRWRGRYAALRQAYAAPVVR